MKRIALAAAVMALGMASTARAYGPEGHALIADMAQANLTPTANAELLRLLALEGAKGLDDVSSWPDAIRSAQPDTGPAHYADIPLLSLAYDEARDCHDDKDHRKVAELTCVVARLPDFAHRLGDRHRPDAERLEALKWVTHLLGDIHQPMHVANRQDAGGNAVMLSYFGKANNLHAVWDGGIIEKQYGWTLGPNYTFDHPAVQRAADEMNAQIAPDRRRAWSAQYGSLEQSAVQWANESHLLASSAYLGLPTAQGEDWQAAYQARFWPAVREQLQKASVRLSAVLNMALSSSEICPSVPGVAFYAGPYMGTEDMLSADDLYRDAYCAGQFRHTKYPAGFVGIFGSSRISEASKSSDPAVAAANNALYRGVRTFAAKWTAAYGGRFPILSGAGPGLMEAASRGATEAGGPSIGYTTYYEPTHDPRKAFWQVNGQPIISDGLIFTSVAARESAMLADSAVIVIGPGGTGTAWEIFQAIETLKSKQLTPAPVFLIGDKATHWGKFYEFVDDMVKRGTLGQDEFYSRITHVDNVDGLFDAVRTRMGLK